MTHQTNQFTTSASALALFALCGYVQAQTVPDAGALQRQTEQSLKSLPPAAQAKRREVLMPPVAKAGDAVVTVEKFSFVGHTMLSKQQLEAVVTPYLNKPLTFSQLQQATDAVTTAYRDAGWLVRAYLPAQKVTDGNFIIQIEEAVFGKAVITGDQQRVDASVLQAIINSAQTSGEYVHAKRIDRALLLLDDVPGITAAGNLIEGNKSNETDLLINATDRGAFAGNFTFDNTGARSTGTGRALASLNVNSPLRIGDAMSFTALKTQGSRYERLAYSVPMGGDGWRAGVHTTYLKYEVLGGVANGSAASNGLDLTYPILRSQIENLNFLLNYDSKRFYNYGGASDDVYNVGVYNVIISGNSFDNLSGGGSNNYSISIASGNSNKSTDVTAAATAGNYTRTTLNLSRLQTITNELSGYVMLTVQRSGKNLDSSEKLYLGGASGVRAYPSSEGGGSQGQTFTAELRQRMNSQVNVTGFYDYGYATAYKNNLGSDGVTLNSGSGPNNYSLRGYGLSVAYQPKSGVDLRATLSRRIGENSLTTTGLDSDGTKRLNRLWINALFSY